MSGYWGAFFLGAFASTFLAYCFSQAARVIAETRRDLDLNAELEALALGEYDLADDADGEADR
jgi:hypothetical protein